MADAAVELKVLISVLQDAGGLKGLLTDVQTLLEGLKRVDNTQLQHILQQLQLVSTEAAKLATTAPPQKAPLEIPSTIAEPDDTHVTAVTTRLESDPVEMASTITEPDDTHVTAITTKLESDPVDMASRIAEPDVVPVTAAKKKLEEAPVEIPAKITVDPVTPIAGLKTTVTHLTENVTLPIPIEFPPASIIEEKLRTSGILGAVNQPDGGFTYQPVSAAQPTTGFALSLHKEREETIPIEQVTLQKLVEYVVKNRDLLAQPSNYLGGWHNPEDDKAYLDVSTVVKTREEAIRLGREAKQLAYFDLAQGKSFDIPPVELKVDTGQATQKVEELAKKAQLPPTELNLGTSEATWKAEELAAKVHQFTVDGQPITLDTAAAKAKVEEVASAVQSIAPVPPKFPTPDTSEVDATKTRLESTPVIIPSKVSQPTVVRDTSAGGGPPKQPWVQPTLQPVGMLRQTAQEALNVGAGTQVAAAGMATLQQGMAKVDHAAGLVTRSLRFMMGGVLAIGAVRFIKDLADVAARTEVLGTVLHVVGNNAGYTNEEIDKVDQSIRKLGITAQSSRQSITQLLQSKMKLEFAPALARASQDLAVIAGWNSSQTFQRLILNIQQLDTMGLRWMGIVVSRAQAEEKYAQKINKTAEQLTQRQKVEALTIAVLEKATTLQGTYEAAMGDVGKQLTSMARYTETLKEEMGDGLLPAYLAIVEELTLLYQELIVVAQASNVNKTAAEGLGDAVREWARWVGDLIMVLVEHKDQIFFFVEWYLKLKIALFAATLAWGGWLRILGMVEGFRKLLVVMNALIAGQISLKVATEAMGAANAKAAMHVMALAVAEAAATTRAAGFTSGLVAQQAATIGLTTQVRLLATSVALAMGGWAGLVALAAAGIVTTVTIIRSIREEQARHTPGAPEHTKYLEGLAKETPTVGTISIPPVAGYTPSGGAIYAGGGFTATADQITAARREIERLQNQYDEESRILESMPTSTGKERRAKEEEEQALQWLQRAIETRRKAWDTAVERANLPEAFKEAQTAALKEALKGATPFSEELPEMEVEYKGHPEWANDAVYEASQDLIEQYKKDAAARNELRKVYATADTETEVKAAEARYNKVRQDTKNAEELFDKSRKALIASWGKERVKAEEDRVARKKELAERQALDERATQSQQELFKGKVAFGVTGQVMTPGATTALGAYETQLELLDQALKDRNKIVERGGAELQAAIELSSKGLAALAGKEGDAYRAANDLVLKLQSQTREGLRLYAETIKTPEDLRGYRLKVEEYLKMPGADVEGAKKWVQEAEINVTDYLNSLNAKRVAKAKEWHKLREDAAVQANEQDLAHLKQHHQQIEQAEDFQYANGLMRMEEYYANRRARIQAETDAEVALQLTKLAYLRTQPIGKGEEAVARQTQIKALIDQLERLMGEVDFRAMEVHRLETEVEKASAAKKPAVQKELATAQAALTAAQANPEAYVGEATLKIEADINRQLAERKQLTRQIEDMTLQLGASYGSLDAILEQISVNYERQAETLAKIGNGEAVLKAIRDRDEFNAVLEQRNRLMQQWFSLQQTSLDWEKARIDTLADAGWMTTTEHMRASNSIILAQMDLVRQKLQEEQEVYNERVDFLERSRESFRDSLIAQGVSVEAATERASGQFTELELGIEQARERMIQLDKEVFTLGQSMLTYGKQLQQFFSDSLGETIAQAMVEVKKSGELFIQWGLGITRNITGVIGREISQRITRSIIEATSDKVWVKNPQTGQMEKQIVPGTTIFDKLFKAIGLGAAGKAGLLPPDGSALHPYTVIPGPGWMEALRTPTMGPSTFVNPAVNFSGFTPTNLNTFGGWDKAVKTMFQTVGGPNQGLTNAMNQMPGFLNAIKTLFAPKPSFSGPMPFMTWGGFLAEGGPVEGAGTGTSDSILARVSAGEHIMPAEKTKTWLPVLEGIRKGTIPNQVATFLKEDALIKFVAGGVVPTLRTMFQDMPAQMPQFAMGGVVGELPSLAVPTIIPRQYVGGGIVQSDAGASAVSLGRMDGNMTVQLDPNALHMTMREWLEREVVYQHSRR